MPGEFAAPEIRGKRIPCLVRAQGPRSAEAAVRAGAGHKKGRIYSGRRRLRTAYVFQTQQQRYVRSSQPQRSSTCLPPLYAQAAYALVKNAYGVLNRTPAYAVYARMSIII